MPCSENSAPHSALDGNYPQSPPLRVGLDLGSTTIKAIILDASACVAFSSYTRHNSDVRGGMKNILAQIASRLRGRPAYLAITGSGGLEIAGQIGAPFIQEVLACNVAVKAYYPDADVILELGGEDAKVTYLKNGLEQRMNETCAGGTGAFIDQMAAFLGTDAAGLDTLAQKHATIHPIASRCGVFAKSDILPLLNEGCPREDIAASIMQAVVNQTVGGLAKGRPIAGKVVFLGGPLHFLSSLRQCFQKSLPGMTTAIFPQNSHFFVALGAALQAGGDLFDFGAALGALDKQPQNSTGRLEPLFATQRDYQAFISRHGRRQLREISLDKASGVAWLGIDCGSTTLKMALINNEGALLHSFYTSHRGNPLDEALAALAEIYRRKRDDLIIGGGCATGYGSGMLKAALHLDLDEVETVAHLAAARYFDPDVTFILDIGGQDIKCMHVKNGFIDRIALNEACSSGCGSFIENFADSLGYTLPGFVQAAIAARAPVDLGSRCTVFMNSKVRQAQKEGAHIGDIAAGLAYSVVRNAIYKVMKIPSASSLGAHVAAQGGAFLNDALLRALEKELGINVSRPPQAGLMGAFGAALLARARLERKHAGIIGAADLAAFKAVHKTARCQGCANACLLSISSFGGGRKYISGNRCERGSGASHQDLPNLPAWKYQRLFGKYLEQPQPDGPSIGLPRALNIYENFPLWFTIFTSLGFRVRLSRPSSRELFIAASDTIPSQTVCYPAKLAHGHVLDLLDLGVKNIFFPCIIREQAGAGFQAGLFNCPVVTSYPELLGCNMGRLKEPGINYMHPFLPLNSEHLPARLRQIPLFANFSQASVAKAVAAGFAEMAAFRADIRQAGENALRFMEEHDTPGVILAGHPYHIDPEISHSMAELANSCGLAVLTDDSIAHLEPDPGRLRFVDQWAYHSRLYRAGAFAKKVKNLSVLQLVSFGCGLDAITGEQLEEITRRGGRLYAQIKIDEGDNRASSRIRIRSLLAAMRDYDQCQPGRCAQLAKSAPQPGFLPQMRHTHTLLVPQMSPMHFQFASDIFAAAGYRAELLPHVSRNAVQTGLRHVNNDICFPAVMIVGQLMEAINSGKYDTDKIALVISQTGGGCRATNYIGFLRKALADAGLGHIPIANFSTSLKGPGIRLTRRLLRGLIMGAHYGDALNRMVHRMRPYEAVPGSTDALAAKWSALAGRNIRNGGLWLFQKNILRMIAEFDSIPLTTESRRPRFGVVGEILLKYHPDANNHIVKVIEDEGGEAILTDIMDFFLYSVYDQIYDFKVLDGARKNFLIARFLISFLEATRFALRLGFGRSRHFARPALFKDLQSHAQKIISLGHQTGEGWLLGSEMERMLHDGAMGILCIQPFGCLPNHIMGKGLFRELKSRYPDKNLIALDFDSGTSEANQINRIKLLIRASMA